MARSWTPAQEAAIAERDLTLLISAAAGAGKTASLTERIIRKLTDPVSPAEISRLLIVTFTRAAASELRERISLAISEALAKNPTSRHLASQLVHLSEAQICTIDAFCLDVVRSNFSSLGLPPKFRMADAAELTVLRHTVMNEVIERFYREYDAFGHFSDHFATVRSDRNLAEVFLSLHRDLLKHPSGLEFLKENAAVLHSGETVDYFRTPFGEISSRETADFLEVVVSTYENAVTAFSDDSDYEKYALSFAEELSEMRVLLSLVKEKDYSRAREFLLTYESKRLPVLKRGTPQTKDTEFYKAQRTAFHKDLKKLKLSRFLLSEADIARAMKESAQASEMLYQLLSEYDTAITAQKRLRGICDFDDIRRYTYDLLVTKDGTPTPLAETLSEKYDEIYIDEYQDVDRVQDLIFSSIAKPRNRFLVGDIKQSIYGFRGAEPAVFASYRDRFPLHGTENAENSDNAAIYMSNNFRCDPPIIHFTNLVCGSLFSLAGGALSYRKEDDLIPSKGLPAEYTPLPVEVVQITKPKDEEDDEENESPSSALSPEAVYITTRIRSLLRDGRKANGEALLPSDIAVLTRNNAMLMTVREALDAAGIPSCISAEEEFFENPDVLLLLCLLNTIDNPRRDIYLTGTLRSPLYAFTMEDLVRIRTSADESLSLFDALLLYAERENETDIPLRSKCEGFLRELEEYRTAASKLPVDKLLRRIFENPHLIASGGLVFSSGKRRHLLRLYEYARKFESGAFRGLSQFISYVDKLMEENATMEVPAEENENAVRLMTIHKSKGLEFPVCILAGASKAFRLAESKQSLLYEGSVGVAMKLADESGFGRIHTPMRDALATRITEKALEEEMRVLYVALTRARENLIVTGYTADADRVLERAAIRATAPSRYHMLLGRSYMEWILSALSMTPDFGSTHTVYRTVYTTSLENISKAASNSMALPTLNEDEVSALKDLFRERFDFAYPHASLSRLPAKLSVSVLSPTILDDPPPEERFRDEENTSQHAEHKKAAEQGTATHCFLQFCDFDRAKKSGAKAELERLVSERFLAPDTGDLCRMDELEAFFQSDLFRMISSAKKIYREKRFNIFLPATLFTEDDHFSSAIRDEKILVQGVIDLFFVDKNDRLVLCDYKTDRLSEKEAQSDALIRYKMKDRHGEQLLYYALAIEQLLGRKPDLVLVYATAAHRAVEIPL